MTKVILSPLLRDYCEGIAGLVNQVREQVTSMRGSTQSVYWPDPAPTAVPPPSLPGLLAPPRINLLDAAIWLVHGQMDGIIQINTVDDFGILNIYVTLRDERGNLIEGGYAMKNEVVEDHWGYVPSASVRPGTSLTVRAVAVDALGGVATRTEQVEL